jgi:hypothetical protein
MTATTINFVKEFTDCPGGRKRIHGEFSGEEFRENFLKPRLRDFDKVVVDLNGAYGFPSSFIDEAFGLLVEEVGYETVRSKLDVKLDDDATAFREINECIEAHRKGRGGAVCT